MFDRKLSLLYLVQARAQVELQETMKTLICVSTLYSVQKQPEVERSEARPYIQMLKKKCLPKPVRFSKACLGEQNNVSRNPLKNMQECVDLK